jgi:hypothetical protein
MPDWKSLVREKIEALELPPGAKEEVVAELAAHFEDLVEQARSEGLNESEAFERAEAEVADWHQLAAQIQRMKQREGPMNERTKSFWVPGLISFVAATIFLVLISQISYVPRVVVLRSSQAVFIYPIWLAVQPICGALGAYFSRRAGGTRAIRLAAGLFPSLILVASVFVVLLINALKPGRNDIGTMGAALFFRSVIGAVLIPAVAMLLGALPFLRGSTRTA